MVDAPVGIAFDDAGTDATTEGIEHVLQGAEDPNDRSAVMAPNDLDGVGSQELAAVRKHGRHRQRKRAFNSIMVRVGVRNIAQRKRPHPAQAFVTEHRSVQQATANVAVDPQLCR